MKQYISYLVAGSFVYGISGTFAQDVADISPAPAVPVGVYDWGCVGGCTQTLNASAAVTCPSSEDENRLYDCVSGCSADVAAKNMYVAGWEIQHIKSTAVGCVGSAVATENTTASTAAESTGSIAGSAPSKSATSTSSRNQSGQNSPSSPADAEQVASALSRLSTEYTCLVVALGVQFAVWIW